jgi:hypothetical protein
VTSRDAALDLNNDSPFYIRNWSLALDGYILLSAALFTRKGAY